MVEITEMAQKIAENLAIHFNFEKVIIITQKASVEAQKENEVSIYEVSRKGDNVDDTIELLANLRDKLLREQGLIESPFNKNNL